MITRVLVIGLSNIGDAVLMSPVVQQLHEQVPDAETTLLVGERAKAVFDGDPRIDRLLCFEEFEGWWGRLRLLRVVWALNPDLLIDLRQTALPLLWKPWRLLCYYWPVPKAVVHMRDRHLWRLHRQAGRVAGSPTKTPPRSLDESPGHGRGLLLGMSPEGRGSSRSPGFARGAPPALWITDEDATYASRLIQHRGLSAAKPMVILCPGARSHIKRWYADRFAALADRLITDVDAEVVFTGEPGEAPIVTEILGAMRHRAHNAVGRLTLRQLAALMQGASLVVTNDSASLHIAASVGAPILALFGPTDPRKYGPTGARDRVIRRQLFCSPCESATCRFQHECLRFISVDEVYEMARQMLGGVRVGA